MSHDFSGSLTKYTHDDDDIIDVSLAYLGLSTNDELQSVIGQSEFCKQAITVSSKECVKQIKWISLNDDEWKPPSMCNGYVEIGIYNFMIYSSKYVLTFDYLVI